MRTRSDITPSEGGRSFRYYLFAAAFATVPVELTREELTEIAENAGVAVEDLSLDDLHEKLNEKAYENVPTLGVCCSGGNFAGQPTLSLADDWESADDWPFNRNRQLQTADFFVEVTDSDEKNGGER